ncbi:conserved hypothetical protein [uncultured spirochete]|jgi:uncharacterized protein YecE (DUF72 family)|uniref:DUF72 domain-containing protein n=1 Tax=uncultured spirochete TaxID=156406 RepID=A0A3P3XLG6_9SPIR|nr:DUF72 domain-containing protein [Rectinema subterraneum]SLM15394.1 conserved hypothetical protein [uncultured spirochete]
MNSSIRFGTCSWNYPSWVGLVYAETQRRAAAYLREYSQKYDTVEVDSWFYKIPDREEVADYLAQVLPSFRFTCKVPQELTLTHLRGNAGASTGVPNPSFLSPDLFARFLEAVEPMIPRLDAIMFEFEYLGKDKMPSLEAFLEKLDDFLTAVRERARGLPLAIESRNRNYLSTAYFSFLRDRRLIPVFSEKRYLPHVYEVYWQYRNLVDTDIVIRLLGCDRAEIEKKTNEQWNTIHEAKPDKQLILQMAMDIASQGHKVTINVNNHYEGSAPLTIEVMQKIQQKLGAEKKSSGS